MPQMTPEQKAAKDEQDRLIATRVWADGIHVGMGKWPGDPEDTKELRESIAKDIEARRKARAERQVK